MVMMGNLYGSKFTIIQHVGSLAAADVQGSWPLPRWNFYAVSFAFTEKAVPKVPP
jgi:hypothetical protein